MPVTSPPVSGSRFPAFGLLGLTLLGVMALACSDDGPSEPEFAADLEATVLLDGEARVGEEVRVLVRVENNGPDVATDVSIGLDLPADLNVTQVENQGTMEGGSVTWSVGALEPIQIRVVGVRLLLEDPGELNFQGRASSAIHDPNPTNNSQVALDLEVMPITETDLVVDLHAPMAAAPGGEVEYRVVTRNAGLIPAEDVVTRLDLVSDPEVLEISDGGVATDGIVEWPGVSSLAAGDSLVRTARVQMAYTSSLEARASAETTTDESRFSNSNGTAPHSRSTVYPALEALGEFTGAESIFTMELVDDLDGDGISDLVVASPLAGGGVVHAVSPATGEEIWTFSGDAQPGRLGYSLAGGQDLDGDGVSDVLAGAPGQVGEDGEALLLSGADGSVIFELQAAVPHELLGISAAFVGDLDGDGRAEMALGAPRAAVQEDTVGAVHVYSSRDGTLLQSLVPDEGVTNFSVPILSPGDLDGNGVEDLIVGAADGYRAISLPSGDRLFGPVVEEGAFASFLRMSPDLDGDGSPEILIPASEGRTWILASSGTVLDVIQTGESSVGLGYASSVGDWDSDGVPDILVGEPGNDQVGENAGKLYLYSGADRSLVLTHVGLTELIAVGQDMLPVGDLDGDGIGDLAVMTGVDDPGLIFLKGVTVSR